MPIAFAPETLELALESAAPFCGPALLAGALDDGAGASTSGGPPAPRAGPVRTAPGVSQGTL